MAKFVTAVYCLLAVVGYDVRVMADYKQLRTGWSTETHSCNSVRSPPQELADPLVFRPDGVNLTFYTKYTEAYGLPVLGSSNLTDDALKRACYTVRFLFADHAGIRAILYWLGGRFAIMSSTEVTLDFPEFSHMDPYWNTRARGLGGTWSLPLSTGAEENVLCQKNDRYRNEDIFLHEASHALQLVAAWVAIPGFGQNLTAVYDNAMSKGLWNNTYAASSKVEYWAEGVQSFFNVETEGPPGGDGIQNDINTRKELKVYDPTLFQLIKTAFPCNNQYLKRCKSTREMENSQVLKMNCNTEGQEQIDFIERLTLRDPNCSDKRPVDCLYWSLTGECDKSPDYMLWGCKASCKVCTPSAQTN